VIAISRDAEISLNLSAEMQSLQLLVEERIQEHDLSPESHKDLRIAAAKMQADIDILQLKIATNVTANPFSVTFESLDQEKVFFAARYGRGEADYINCPMDKEQYERFYQALVTAESVELHEFERKDFQVYEGCMPVEVMAKRGADTLRYGPLKPVGLTDPRTGHRPWAVVQLRSENREGTLYNLVGFQTNLKFPEQKRVFSLIPGLEQAEFVRYGVMHRNTFLNSPKLLTPAFHLRANPDIYFAGQMTGVEGYVESAASGILAAKNLVRALQGKVPLLLPADCMLGALSRYISDGSVADFQPMGANMGILPPWPERVRDKTVRYEKIAQRGLDSLRAYLQMVDETATN